MRFPALVPCQCGTANEVEATGTERFPADVKCPVCQTTTHLIDNSTVGRRVLYRSQAELQSGDFTLSIILSAMAVECELAFMFFKWKRIDSNLAKLGHENQLTARDSDSWEQEYREAGSITRKLDRVCHDLTNADFDTFIDQPHLTQFMQRECPESAGTSPKHFFAENLFWKRNEIVHAGKVDFAGSNAEQYLKLASSLFVIMSAMDSAKYNHTFPAPTSRNTV
jgi:hypothetical protein